MKKLLLLLVAVATFGLANATDLKFDFTNQNYGMPVQNESDAPYLDDGYTITQDAVSITIKKNDGNGARLYKATNGNITFRVMNKATMTIAVNGGVITKIAMTANSGLTSLKSSDEAFKTSSAKAGEWTGSESSVKFSATGTVQLQTITVTYGGGVADTRKDAGLSFPESKYTIEFGDPFTAPVLTKATTAPVTYSSDATKVATVDATTGAVTVVGTGTARITASAEANAEYKAGNTSYLLTVKEKIVAPEGSVYFSAMGEDFTFENPEGIKVWNHDSSYGLKASAFISGTINAAEAYAASPVLDLTKVKNPTLKFQQALNNYKINNKMISVDDFAEYAYVVAREEGETDWVVVSEVAAPASFSWTFYENEPVSLAKFAGTKMQVGFLYVSTAECAGTWEVKQIAVLGDSDAIETVDAENASAPVEYFNLQGVRVANPEGGIFIRRQGSSVSKVVVR